MSKFWVSPTSPHLCLDDFFAPTSSFPILQLAERQNLLVEEEDIQIRFER
jgi:hypothetical protein